MRSHLLLASGVVFIADIGHNKRTSSPLGQDELDIQVDTREDYAGRAMIDRQGSTHEIAFLQLSYHTLSARPRRVSQEGARIFTLSHLHQRTGCIVRLHPRGHLYPLAVLLKLHVLVHQCLLQTDHAARLRLARAEGGGDRDDGGTWGEEIGLRFWHILRVDINDQLRPLQFTHAGLLLPRRPNAGG